MAPFVVCRCSPSPDTRCFFVFISAKRALFSSSLTTNCSRIFYIFSIDDDVDTKNMNLCRWVYIQWLAFMDAIQDVIMHVIVAW